MKYSMIGPTQMQKVLVRYQLNFNEPQYDKLHLQNQSTPQSSSEVNNTYLHF